MDWEKVSKAARAESTPFPAASDGYVSDRIRLGDPPVYFHRIRGVAPNGKKIQVVREDEFEASKLFALAMAENGGPPVVRGQFTGYTGRGA